MNDEVMITNLKQYLETLGAFIDQEDYDISYDAAQLLSLRDEHVECTELHIADPDEISYLLQRYLVYPFDALTALHLRLLWLLAEERYEESFKAQKEIIQLFIKEVIQKRKDENWFMPLLFRLCSDTRLCAKAADLRPSKPRAPEQSSFYEQAAAPMMDCFRSCVADSRANMDVSKRLAIMNLTNQLFRIYFRINKLNLLKPLIRAIDNCGELYEHFSIADRVTYSYFLGRKAMFDSELKTSEKSLTYAFENCPADSFKNKRLILMYLIPVKMFLGHMPNEKLLTKYNLLQFKEVAESVKEGNLLKLDKALETHEHFFIKCGIFLMLEKLKIITYRTLLKKICNLMGTHLIPLDAFLVALKLMEVEDVDLDETACIIANLIYQGKVKGYISHQHQKLVISKQNAFPALSSIIV